VKIILECLIIPFWSSWSLDLQGFNGHECSHASLARIKCVYQLIVVPQDSSWSLDQLLKRTLIAWFQLQTVLQATRNDFPHNWVWVHSHCVKICRLVFWDVTKTFCLWITVPLGNWLVISGLPGRARNQYVLMSSHSTWYTYALKVKDICWTSWMQHSVQW